MATLVEICEPLFQYVCRLNRLGRKGGRTDYGIVRSELKAIFADMRTKAEQTPGLAGPYGEAERVLIFFTDSMILNSRLPPGWKPISHELGELGFEEKFWDLLDDTMRDPSDSATQRLAVYYVCIGLGFTGLYTGQPDYIRRKMLEIAARMRGMIDADQLARICPDAYENVDTRNLTLPPNRSLMSLVIVLVVMVGVLLVAYVELFRNASRGLRDSLEAITTSEVPERSGS
ncbi:MAG: DotU family type IV/VI secretion system protein [Planctomycetota bacterium]|nr:DotU family type IV/VI secretion system protein [Planctomycetota bacterium]